ncbi:DUF6233 domain-containing protein, partial [Streptomyces sp. NPDC001275]
MAAPHRPQDHQVVQRQAEQDRGRRAKPRPAEWIVELGIGAGRPPTQVHRGSCYMAGKRHRPISRDEARSLLAAGTCTHCRPDRDLGIIGLGRPANGSLEASGGGAAVPAVAARCSADQHT